MGPVKYLGAVNIGQIAVITDAKDEASSVLHILDLHSPVRVKSTIELPSVTGFVATEAVIVIAVEGGSLRPMLSAKEEMYQYTY